MRPAQGGPGEQPRPRGHLGCSPGPAAHPAVQRPGAGWCSSAAAAPAWDREGGEMDKEQLSLGDNRITLVGRLSGEVVERELPSGDVVANFRRSEEHTSELQSRGQ